MKSKFFLICIILFNFFNFSILNSTETIKLESSKIELIEKYIEQVDLILIMSVEPGFGGQKFMPEVLNKTKMLREIIDERNLKVDIEIDGGINFENCSRVKKAGANIIVSGSTIFKENSGDLKKI